MDLGLTLDEIIAGLNALPPEHRGPILKYAEQVTAGQLWVPNPGPQTDAYFCEADELFYGGQAGGGKGQPLDAPILTPFGFRPMGNLNVGSKVCNPDGSISSVIGVYPLGSRQIYKVTFHDGVSCEVTDDHIWLAWIAGGGSKKNGALQTGECGSRLLTTVQLMAALKKGLRPVMPITDAVTYNDTARYSRRPVNPYLLGVLLGNGSITSKAFRISCAEPEIVNRITDLTGIEFSQYKYGGRVAEYRMREPNNIRPHLAKWGLVGCGSADKFIPAAYLRGSQHERWELLRGLMDTDGWADKDGDTYYCTISPMLRDDVAALARSLGAMVTIRSKQARAQNGNDSTAYTLRIKLRDASHAFALERKRKICEGKTVQSMGRRLVSIEPSRIAEAQCIRVNHPNSLYITNDFIVTHNTDLGLGLALTSHTRSLVLRRVKSDAVQMADRVAEILNHRDGFNGQDKIWRLGDRLIRFDGCEHEFDKERHKGKPYDLYYFDELPDFSESQFRFIKTWNRSTKAGQRCRVVCGSNPPTSAEGLWVIKYWAPWLDRTHPNPAKPGELRWYVGTPDGDLEVDGRGPHKVAGEKDLIEARSRTYIPAAMADNPDLAQDGQYAAVLAGLSGSLRAAYRDGDFSAGLRDDANQLIPTKWIVEAQNRWHENGGKGQSITAMGFDPAGGGRDSAELAIRCGYWYAPLVSAKGVDTADGSSMAATIIKHRRNKCPVIIDVGGGYGGAVITRLEDNGVAYSRFNGGSEGQGKANGGLHRFANKRAEAYWRFREALDPDQDGGSLVALPDDAELRADLAAPKFSITPRGILIESKDDIRKRLGRSPGKSDAVVMAWSEGEKAAQAITRASDRGGAPVKVNMGHSGVRKR